MGALAIEAGRLEQVQQSLPVTESEFGYAYSGFKSVDRFIDQIAGDEVGMIGWPGGALAEKSPEKYGLNFDGLFNPAMKRPGLADMFEIARGHDAEMSVILPTARYEGQDATLRSDIRGFMGKLLAGHYGPLPKALQLEIGNEWYFAFGGSPADAVAYGHVADIYVDEISRALNDPSVNKLGADVKIAVQSGRSLAEDEIVRSEFQGDHLAEVDLVIHHRFPFTAQGVAKVVPELGTILDAWKDDAQALGGEGPHLFLGSYNVASYTREEAIADYLKAEAKLGNVHDRADIDMQNRTDDGFEQFWQNALGKREYGPAHARVMLETFAQYGSLGVEGAATYGSDMQHSGRLSVTDVHGKAQDFVGQDVLDMMAEATKGAKLLKFSLDNDASDPVWAYGYENADKLVVFLSADANPPGKFSVSVKGLGTTYKAVYGDSLTSQVPADWMERFGIPDNPDIDETNESRGFAIGTREGFEPKVEGAGVTVQMDDPHEVIRLSFAKTAAGLREIEGFSDGERVELTGPETVEDAPGGDTGGGGLGDVPHVDHPNQHPDGVDDGHGGAHDGADAAADHGGFGPGAGLLAFLPLLFFL